MRILTIVDLEASAFITPLTNCIEAQLRGVAKNHQLFVAATETAGIAGDVTIPRQAMLNDQTIRNYLRESIPDDHYDVIYNVVACHRELMPGLAACLHLPNVPLVNHFVRPATLPNLDSFEFRITGNRWSKIPALVAVIRRARLNMVGSAADAVHLSRIAATGSTQRFTVAPTYTNTTSTNITNYDQLPNVDRIDAVRQRLNSRFHDADTRIAVLVGPDDEDSGADTAIRAFTNASVVRGRLGLILIGEASRFDHLCPPDSDTIVESVPYQCIHSYREILAASDVFVAVPPRFDYGYHVAEALAAGKKIVATAVGAHVGLLQCRSQAALCEPEFGSSGVRLAYQSLFNRSSNGRSDCQPPTGNGDSIIEACLSRASTAIELVMQHRGQTRGDR